MKSVKGSGPCNCPTVLLPEIFLLLLGSFFLPMTPSCWEVGKCGSHNVGSRSVGSWGRKQVNVGTISVWEVWVVGQPMSVGSSEPDNWDRVDAIGYVSNISV